MFGGFPTKAASLSLGRDGPPMPHEQISASYGLTLREGIEFRPRRAYWEGTAMAEERVRYYINRLRKLSHTE